MDLNVSVSTTVRHRGLWSDRRHSAGIGCRSVHAYETRHSGRGRSPLPSDRHFHRTADPNGGVTPLGHLSLALLAGTRLQYDRRALALCLAAAVVPDVVDKPLGWCGPFVTTHTLAHSVITLAVVTVAIRTVPRLRRFTPVVPGYAAHIVADLIVAYPKFLTNYAWPVLEQRPTPEVPVVDYWLAYVVSPPGAVEFAVVATAAWVLARRGLPPTAHPA